MKAIHFSPTKVFNCGSLVKDSQEEFEIIYNQTKTLKMKKFEAILLSNLIYSIISTDNSCSSYQLQCHLDDEIITSFFAQISSTNFDISLDKADRYLIIAKELGMPEVIEAINFNAAMILIQELDLPLVFYDYKSLLQSLAKNINLVPLKWLNSIATHFLVDIYEQYPQFENWNTYTNTIIKHHLPVYYLNDLPIQQLDIPTIENLLNYLIENNTQEWITMISMELARMAQDLKGEIAKLSDIIKNGVTFDKEIDCMFIKSGRDSICGEFWKCLQCCQGDRVICTACKNRCHAGHPVVRCSIDRGYCDCGAGKLDCKCQCMGRTNLIKSSSRI